jgi:hypothetical protein
MKRILIVEDEPAIALGLRNDLQFEGYGLRYRATARRRRDWRGRKAST